jgi:hypothetical protein
MRKGLPLLAFENLGCLPIDYFSDVSELHGPRAMSD